MDLVGGNNPTTPRLDSARPQPQPQSQPQTQGQPFVNPNAQQIGTPLAIPAPAAPMAVPAEQPIAQPPMSPPPALPANPVPNPLDTVSDMGLSSEPSGPVGGKGKVIALVAIGSVLMLSLVIGAFFIGNTTGRSEGRKAADAEYQQREAERQRQEAEQQLEEEEAELALGSELIDPQYVDETVEGDIGKQLSAKDGFVMKVTNIERNYETDDPNYKLDETKELVKINFLMGNIAKEKVKDMTSAAFYLENAEGARLNPENIVSYDGKFDTVKLDPGAQASGSIIYLVNKNEAPLKFAREQRYRFAGENKEVATRTIVNVAE